MTTDQILELNDCAFNSIEKPLAEIASALDTYPVPKTLLTFLGFITKTDFVKNGIFDSLSSDNLYVSMILYRVLIEHVLKFQYLYFRYIEELSDDPVVEYQLFSDLAEDIEYGRAWLTVSRIRGEQRAEDQLWTVLKSTKSEFQQYTVAEIQDKVSQFRYRNIIRYINRKLEDQYKGRDLPILNLIPEYTELSSFVHGGQFDDRALLRYSDPALRTQEHTRIMEMAFSMACSVKELTFSVASHYDPKYGAVATQLVNLRRANGS